MTDQERKDLADSYRLMMDLAAWKHFERMIMNPIEDKATKDEDSVSLDDLTVAKIAECRGRRAAIDKIKNDLDYIVNGIK